MEYIDSEKLLDIIIKKQKEYATQEVTEEHKGLRAVLGGQCFVLTEIIEIIDSLRQEPLDYKEAVQLVFEEELTPFKDGNQWCFLLGGNIQEGICGFGDTILDAAVAFYKDYTNTKIHIGELKISMAQQEQSEVDLEKEIFEAEKKYGDINEMGGYQILLFNDEFRDILHHFYELGLNARKEE